jgi:hypothetical protein
MTKSKKRTKEESSPGANSDQPDKVHKMTDSTPPSMIQPNTSPNMSGTSGSYIPPHLQFLSPQGQPLYQYMIPPPGTPGSPITQYPTLNMAHEKATTNAQVHTDDDNTPPPWASDLIKDVKSIKALIPK